MGFSRLVQEAIDLYLERLKRDDRAVHDAIAVLGTFSEKSAGRLEASVREIRGVGGRRDL